MIDMIASVLGLESSQKLYSQRIPLLEKEKALREILDSRKIELEHYSADGYRAFKNSILLPEKQRLASLLIESTGEDADGRDARLKIRGQHAEVCRLIERPAELTAEIEAIERDLLDTLTAISEVDTKIKSAKAREE